MIWLCLSSKSVNLFDLAQLKQQIKTDEALMDAPHFWDHQRQAKVVIQRLNEQKFFLESLEKLQNNHHHLAELFPMLELEPTLSKSFQQELG
jgi:hypothetical protein